MCTSVPVEVMNANNDTGKKKTFERAEKSSTAFAPLTFSEKSISWRLQSKQNSRQTVTNARALYCHLFFAPNLWIQVRMESVSHMAKGPLICSHCGSFTFKPQLFFFFFFYHCSAPSDVSVIVTRRFNKSLSWFPPLSAILDTPVIKASEGGRQRTGRERNWKQLIPYFWIFQFPPSVKCKHSLQPPLMLKLEKYVHKKEEGPMIFTIEKLWKTRR